MVGSGVGGGMDSWRDGERVERVAVGGVVAVGVNAAGLGVGASGGGGWRCASWLGGSLTAGVGGVVQQNSGIGGGGLGGAGDGTAGVSAFASGAGFRLLRAGGLDLGRSAEEHGCGVRVEVGQAHGVDQLSLYRSLHREGQRRAGESGRSAMFSAEIAGTPYPKLLELLSFGFVHKSALGFCFRVAMG